MPKEEKSILQEEERDIPVYEETEKLYVANLQTRLEKAKTERDAPHKEFDGMTYVEYYDTNEAGCNTYIQSKKNKVDTVFQSGTLRTKMMSLLATMLGLNLKADIIGCDKNNLPIQSLGDSMEDIAEKTEELEGDEEKKMLRKYELLAQGTCFIEDVWHEDEEVKKKVTKGFYGKREGVKWTTKKEVVLSAPRRAIIPGKSVYLGDLSKYDIEDQPFIFTVQSKGYGEAKQMFGDWEMWKYVSKNGGSFSGNMIENNWRLLEYPEETVEIIRYEDKINNEFQIIINGILMLPVGYPLTEISPDGYTIIQQNSEPIRPDFAIGKSFIFKNKNLVAVLDQMMKLAVLKTQKSFMPPYLNLSGKVISRDIFMPGKMSRGVSRGDIVPVSENETQGVTNGEYNMVQEVIKFIDKNTVSQTFSGGKEQGGSVTATQIMELQRQSRIMLGIIILSNTLMEKKLSRKRLDLNLANWFNPSASVLRKGVMQNQYRVVSSMKEIRNEGMGLRIVIPSDKVPTKEEVRRKEEELGLKMGKPVKIIVLNPRKLRKTKVIWFITVNAQEKKSSEYSKMMFDEMLTRGMNLGLPFNSEYIQQRFASIWEEDPSRMFEKQQVDPAQLMAGQGGQGSQQGAGGQPKNISANSAAVTPPGQGSIVQRAQGN